MKNYLLTVLQQCSEHQFGQDAIEWAIVTGRVQLTYDLETDVRLIMGDIPSPAGAGEGGASAPGEGRGGKQTNYDRIIVAYRAARLDLETQTLDALHPLFAEILRPFSLAQHIPVGRDSVEPASVVGRDSVEPKLKAA